MTHDFDELINNGDLTTAEAWATGRDDLVDAMATGTISLPPTTAACLWFLLAEKAAELRNRERRTSR